jgi:hypothetical protein
MKSINVGLKGISPILMHAYPMVAIEALEKKSIEEQAEYSAYRIPGTKKLCVPGLCLQRALVAAAAYSKGKGRASLQKQAAACLTVSPEYLDLGVDSYSIDSRPVVIKATQGRILRHRPRLDSWQVSLVLEFDENLMTEANVRRIVDDAGSRVGVLDFRPERKGPFGRFMVTAWAQG